MRRTDDVYWQRLRKDKRTAAAALLTILAWIVPMVGVSVLVVPGTQGQARGNPLYWLMMLPFAWWAVSLASYEPTPVRLLKPAQVLAPLVAIASAATATRMGEDPTPFWVATAVSAVAAVTGWLLYRGSMLEREGPAR